MILWVRGPSGSGKSYVAHRLLDAFGPGEEIVWPANVPLPGQDRARKTERVVGYALPGDLFVLGPYHVPGGGLDLLGGSVLRTQIPLVERAAKRWRHVFAESLTAGNVTPIRFLEMRDRLDERSLPLRMPVLDTPIDDCLRHIYARQKKPKKINEEVIRLIGARVHQYQERALREGLDAPLLSRKRSYETALEMLRDGGWRP